MIQNAMEVTGLWIDHQPRATMLVPVWVWTSRSTFQLVPGWIVARLAEQEKARRARAAK